MKVDLKGSLTTVPSSVWKASLYILGLPLSHLFNLSLQAGHFPQGLKCSHIVPLYKGKGPKEHPANYRPITLTPFISKLFEKCLVKQLIIYLMSTNFFSEAQYGFLKDKSCDLALCDIFSSIVKSCNNGNAALAGFLDVAKAFDSISHSIFIKILSYFDFSALSQTWFMSYLSERTICVSVGQFVSSSRPVSKGVPQGSVLGPIIFIMYINVLLKYIELWTPLHPVCYADDLSLVMPINKDSTLSDFSSFESSLGTVQSLYHDLGLTLNVEKTEILFIKTSYSRVNPPTPSVSLNGVQISFSSSARCLGLTFNDRMTWSSHFSTIRQKCYGCIATFSRLRSIGFPLSTLTLLYHSLFEPLLTFGIVVWGKTISTHLNQLRVIQKDCIRAILGLTRNSSVTNRFADLKILTINQLYAHRVGCLMFKLLNRPQPLSRFFRDFRSPPLRSTRNYHETDIHVETQHYNYVINAPSHQHVLVWNSIPGHIRSIKSFARFRSEFLDHVRTSLI